MCSGNSLKIFFHSELFLTLIVLTRVYKCIMTNVVVLFWVNENKLTLLNFSQEANTRQKLVAFLFLVDLFCVDLCTSST